jgi:hypothetical protein
MNSYGPDTWQGRAIEATKGTQSRLGGILCAALNTNRTELPRFGTSATIDQQGRVWSSFTTRQGILHLRALVCTVDELVSNFRGLADHLKLKDADRVALFDKLRGWVTKDERVKSVLDF